MSTFQISKFGGLTRAKQAVELCSSLGIAMTIEVLNQYFPNLLKYKKIAKRLHFKYCDDNVHDCNDFLTSMVSIV